MNYHDRAKADIDVAKLIMSPIGNPTNDEVKYDIAAFHVQQAYEKEVKHILHDICGVDDSTRKFKIHDIPALIGQLEQLGIAIPDYVKIRAEDIVDWEAASRYGGSSVADINEIKEAIEYFDKFEEYVSNEIDIYKDNTDPIDVSEEDNIMLDDDESAVQSSGKSGDPA